MEQSPALPITSQLTAVPACLPPTEDSSALLLPPADGRESLAPLADAQPQVLDAHIDDNHVQDDVRQNEIDENGDDDDDDDDDDDASSSADDDEEGGEFMEDFERALDDCATFTGTFAHAALLAHAPNPGLAVEGVGALGLPLSTHDAARVVAASEQAPFGHGERTLVNKEVRDTWEIAAERVRFTNPLWGPFMVNVAKSVSTSLGVAVAASAPRVELYKLLLYETGSHFLPHKDHEKTKGMFATIIIILPSTYTGGQVHVSHNHSSKVFDFSANSAFGTALLSWYTDVTHEVKPVQSGHRLALAYNLVHTAAHAPPPAAPDTSAATLGLRGVLRRWRRDAYADAPAKVCYLLGHHYSAAGLRGAALKGADAHRLAFVRPLCEEQGFRISLAHLECHMSGEPDGEGDTYGMGWRDDWCDEDEDEDGRDCSDMRMEEVNSTTLTVKNLRDLHGRPVAPGTDKFEIDCEDLIPENPFEDMEPDKKEYEGYIGNGAGSMEYWYHRSVMIFWHESQELDILIQIGGVNAALSKLKHPVNPPTTEQTQVANFFLRRLSSVTTAHGTETARTLANAAIVWNNLDLWLTVANLSGAGRKLDILGVDGHVQALKVFPHERLRTVFEEVVQTTPGFTSRVNFIRQLSSVITCDAAFDAWCYGQVTAVLGTLKTLTTDDCPLLMEEAEKRDVSCLRDTIVTQLKKLKLAQSGWLVIIKVLRARAEAVDKPDCAPHPWGSGRDALNAIMGEGLQTVLEQINVNELFKSAPSQHCSRAYHAVCEQGMARTLELLELCVSMDRLNDCRTLLQKLLAPPPSHGDLETRFKTFFTPFVPRLKNFLHSHALREDIPPFKAVFKNLIMLYLDQVVGKPPAGIDLITWAPKSIGCACGDCRELDNFIASPEQINITFRVVLARRKHLLARIAAANARDGQRYSTQIVRRGSPQGLTVTKARKLIAAASWLARQADADAFVESVGGAELLQRILSGDADERTAYLAPRVSMTQAGPSGYRHTLPAADSISVPNAQGKRKWCSDDVIDLT